ncbi:NfeD family protein [Frederiksenia canicola]
MEWLTGWSMWLILGFVLFILETVITGVFIMWWGGAAIIIAIVVALFPDIALSVQFTLFALLAIIFSLAWWKFQQTRDAQEDQANTLNDREHAMLGMQGVIVEILENGVVRGKFGDTTWRVIGKNLKVGDSVHVKKVEGITLFVVKL